jgi:hypothetical protein
MERKSGRLPAVEVLADNNAAANGGCDDCGAGHGGGHNGEVPGFRQDCEQKHGKHDAKALPGFREFR